jgi:two-component system, NtrC family, nitrogen regulation sensor histidine kinase NtrY
MKLRTKLLISFTLTIAGSVGILAWTVTRNVQREFAPIARQRSDNLAEQFRREFAHRGDEVTYAVQSIAEAEGTLRMAMELSRAQADPSLYANDARGIGAARQLDFLDLVNNDGVVISSAHWPERIGFKNDWVTQETDWNQQGAFLWRVEQSDKVELGLMTVRTVPVGEKKLYIVGGKRLDSDFLKALVVPEGMHALLYRNLETAFVPTALFDADGAADQADRFAPLIESMQKQKSNGEGTVRSSTDAATSERYVALPLTGRHDELLGVMLIGDAHDAAIESAKVIRSLAITIGGAALFAGLLLSCWIAAGFTRPLERVEAATREVASGKWDARVDVKSHGEARKFGDAFNQMTRQLSARREKLMQSERVAAWRELARHIAVELKIPLFSLQATLEHLSRTREQAPEQFDEVFFESVKTLGAELETVQGVVAQFSDLARMPQPRLQPVNVNEMIRGVMKAFEPQFHARGRPPITPELQLDENASTISADPEQLHNGFKNLVGNSLGSMPAGGTLTIRTTQKEGVLRIEVSDMGAGANGDDAERLSGSSYSAKLQGAGPGLAILQAVVSDHGGKISVESGLGGSSIFRIELPLGDSGVAAAPKSGLDAVQQKQKFEPTIPESEEAAVARLMDV